MTVLQTYLQGLPFLVQLSKSYLLSVHMLKAKTTQYFFCRCNPSVSCRLHSLCLYHKTNDKFVQSEPSGCGLLLCKYFLSCKLSVASRWITKWIFRNEDQIFTPWLTQSSANSAWKQDLAPRWNPFVGTEEVLDACSSEGLSLLQLKDFQSYVLLVQFNRRKDIVGLASFQTDWAMASSIYRYKGLFIYYVIIGGGRG